MSEFDTLTSPPPQPAASGSSDDRTFALLTHLSGIFLSFVVPLVVWLINRERADKAWLNDQAKESLNFQITILLGYLVSAVLAVILIGGLLGLVVWVVNIVFCILAAVKTSEGVTYRYPFSLRLIK